MVTKHRLLLSIRSSLYATHTFIISVLWVTVCGAPPSPRLFPHMSICMCIANHNLLQLLCFSKRDASSFAKDKKLSFAACTNPQCYIQRPSMPKESKLPCSVHHSTSSMHAPKPTSTEQPWREKSSEQQRTKPITANSINTTSIPSEIQQHILSNHRNQDSTSVPHQLLSHSSIFRAPTADPEST
ncbi:hypothetical protein XPA_005286 [Xanthoria parietina]